MFIVGLLIDTQGKKHALGFWQGATENHEVCKELLHHLESRGLALTSQTLFVIDGGKGMIKALRDRFGRDLSLISDALSTKIAISKTICLKSIANVNTGQKVIQISGHYYERRDLPDLTKRLTS